jgi:signal transduction histidine kinase/predicted membrane protein
MLPWERVLFLLSVGTIASLALFVLLRGRRDLTRVTFSVFLFSVAALDVAVYVVRANTGGPPVDLSARLGLLNIVGRLSFAIGGLNCGTLWAFTEVFPRPRHESTVRKRLFISYAVGGVAFLIALTPWFWKGVLFTDGDYRPVIGLGALPWVAMLLCALGFGVVNLITSYRVLPTGHLRNQVRYTFVGFSFLVWPAALFSILLPSLGNVDYTSVVPFFGSLTAAIITYALVRHRLMDLGIVYRTATIGALVVLFLVAALLGIQSFLSKLLKMPGLASTIIAAGIVTAGFQPLKERITSLTDKYIFKGRYDYRKVVVEFAEKISRILDLRALEKCIVEKTVETMQAENGLIVVADAKFEEYRTEYAVFPGTHLVMDRVLMPGNSLLEELKRSKKVIVEQEVRRTRPERMAGPILDEMARLRSAIVIPLISKDKLLGILSLGEKRSGDIYSAEDVSLLTVLANQVASSLENSRLFNEILLVKNHQGNILQHLRSGVITISQDSRIKSVNQSAAEILNRTRTDLLRQDVSVLGSQLSRLAMKRLQDGFGHFEGEAHVEIKGRGTVPLGVVATTMSGERDTKEVLLVFDDLSEVKLLQERIRRADRLAVVGTFAAGMAHEIKNPLVPIKTFSQLLPEMFDDNEFRSRFSVLVLKEVERINHIIERLLNFARPTKPVLGLCDMHELINEVLLLLEEEVKKKQIDMRKGYTSEPAVIKVDREQIKQVILNLLLNAVQAVESEGRIEISTAYVWERGGDGDGRRFARGRRDAASRRRGNHKVKRFQIKISDNGRGMSDEDQKHLFNPFFTTKPEGTGLGLAISHVIIEEHNGTIDAKSKEGQGATFTLKLPATNDL